MLLSSWNAGYGPIDESPTMETSQPFPCVLSFNIMAEEKSVIDEDKRGLPDIKQPVRLFLFVCC